MTKTCFVAFLAMLATALSLIILAAAPAIGAEMPKKLRGTWCDVPTKDNKAIHRRCRQVEGEAGFIIHARRISTPESECAVHSVVLDGKTYRVNGHCCYRGTSDKCHDDNDTWPLSERYRLFNNGRRLEVLEEKP